jgi:hypothetical protein
MCILLLSFLWGGIPKSVHVILIVFHGVLFHGFCFMCYWTCKFLSLRCIVRSRNLMDSCCSFSIVKFMLDCSLLNSLSVWCMFVLYWSYIISKLSIYLKYVTICCFIRMRYICVCSICCIYTMCPLLLMMSGLPWLTHHFVCSILRQLRNNFVLALFLICVLFLFLILLSISWLFSITVFIMFVGRCNDDLSKIICYR